MIKIIIPWLDKRLMPNNKNGKSWKTTNKHKVAYKESCYYITKQCKQKKFPDGNIELDIMFYPPDKRHRDLDNCLAAIKSGIDGVADALGVNDRRFKPITIDFGESDKNNPRIEIILK